MTDHKEVKIVIVDQRSTRDLDHRDHRDDRYYDDRDRDHRGRRDSRDRGRRDSRDRDDRRRDDHARLVPAGSAPSDTRHVELAVVVGPDGKITAAAAPPPAAKPADAKAPEVKKPVLPVKPAHPTAAEVKWGLLSDLKSPILPESGEMLAFSWDVCLVFAVGKKDAKIKTTDGHDVEQTRFFASITEETEKKILAADLKTHKYLSCQEDEIYMLIGATESRLRREADRQDYEIELVRDEVIEQGCRTGMKLAVSLREVADLQKAEEAKEAKEAKDRKSKFSMNFPSLPDQLRFISDTSWDVLYGKYNGYDTDFPYRQRLYKIRPDAGPSRPHTIFRSTDRIRLIDGILQADTLVGGAGLAIGKLLHMKEHPVIAYFPFHEQAKKEKLAAKWLKWSPLFHQPLDDVRDYFGEKVSMYFGFLEFYCRWLIAPSLIGIVLACWQWGEGRIDIEILPIYGIAVAVYATIFLEFWKRQESCHRTHWGMTNFKLREPPRPEFKGDLIRDPVNGQLTKYFSFTQRLWRAMSSQTAIWILIAMVIGCVVGIFFCRALLSEWNAAWGSTITAVINSVQIQVMNAIYGKVSVWLNEFENHRTPSDFENALIAKSFLFKFVNSYNSLFYIAFLKEDNACMMKDCLIELQVQLAIIFGLAILLNNTMELAIPWIKGRITASKNFSITGPRKSDPEVQFDLEAYESTFADFDEMAVQFGYVCLFVVAFPIAPLLALLNNVVEIRLDAHKLCHLHRRPNPQGASNIGTWYYVFNTISFCGVITNVLIIVFKTDLLNEWFAYHRYAYRVWCFVAIEHFILLLKFALAFIVPDEPSDIQDHIARQEYLVDVLINGMQEEEEDNFIAKPPAVDSKTAFDPSTLPRTLVDEQLKYFADPPVRKNLL